MYTFGVEVNFFFTLQKKSPGGVNETGEVNGEVEKVTEDLKNQKLDEKQPNGEYSHEKKGGRGNSII